MSAVLLLLLNSGSTRAGLVETGAIEPVHRTGAADPIHQTGATVANHETGATEVEL